MEQQLRNCVVLKCNSKDEPYETLTNHSEPLDFDLDYVLLVNPQFCNDEDLLNKVHVKLDNKHYEKVPILLIKHEPVLRYLHDVKGVSKKNLVVLHCIPKQHLWENRAYDSYKPSKTKPTEKLEEHKVYKKTFYSGTMITFTNALGKLMELLCCDNSEVLQLWLKSCKATAIDMLAWIVAHQTCGASSHTDSILDLFTLFTTELDGRHFKVCGEEGVSCRKVKMMKTVRLAANFTAVYLMEDDPAYFYMTEVDFSKFPGKFSQLYNTILQKQTIAKRILDNFTGYRLDHLWQTLWHNLISIEFLPRHPSMKEYDQLTVHGDMIYVKFCANPYNQMAVREDCSAMSKMKLREVCQRRLTSTSLEAGFFSLISLLLIKL